MASAKSPHSEKKREVLDRPDGLRFSWQMDTTKLTKQCANDIEQLVELAGCLLTPGNFSTGLDEDQIDILLKFHASIASRFGSKSASRSVARIGGVSGLQALLKAMHKRKLAGSKQNKLHLEIEKMLANSQDIDRVRAPIPPTAPKQSSE